VSESQPKPPVPVVVAVDDELTAGIIEAALASAGHRVLRARHGAHALKILDRTEARVVILDLNTARRAGLEVLRNLQGHQARGAMRVLALTVQSRGDAEDEARRAGADDFLMRPFNPTELVSRVELLYRRTAAA
jgi:DNA-binding response OmpR family regulator